MDGPPGSEQAIRSLGPELKIIIINLSDLIIE